MKPLNLWSPKSDPHFRDRAVFAFDLDETLTWGGRLSSAVIASLEDLGRVGIRCVIVTGRPAGWADALMKLLPIESIIAENGGLIYRRLSATENIAPEVLFWTPAGYKNSREIDLSQNARFEKILADARARFPRVREARDQFARIYDLAIDFAEFVQPPLKFEEADEIRKIFEAHGATAKVSSIHVNGWFGNFSKSDALRKLVEDFWKLDPAKSVVYMGDSPNDASLFESLELSVGVANLKHFDELDFRRPTYITKHEEGQGVVECIQHFLKLRGSAE